MSEWHEKRVIASDGLSDAGIAKSEYTPQMVKRKATQAKIGFFLEVKWWKKKSTRTLSKFTMAFCLLSSSPSMLNDSSLITLSSFLNTFLMSIILFSWFVSHLLPIPSYDTIFILVYSKRMTLHVWELFSYNILISLQQHALVGKPWACWKP